MNRDLDTGSQQNLFCDATPLNELIDVLEELGISLRDTSGEFRALSNVIDDVMKAWGRSCSLHRSRQLGDAAQSLVYMMRAKNHIDVFKQEADSESSVELDEFFRSICNQNVRRCFEYK